MVIVKRRDKFVVDYYDSSGVRHRPSFETKSEAEAYAQSGIDEAPALSFEPVSIKDSIRKYYDTVSVRKGQKTYKYEKYYFSKLYQFLTGKCGLVHIGEIKLLHLEQYQTMMVKELMASTVNRHFNTIRAFLNRCVDWEMIEKSPGDRLKQLPEAQTMRPLWSDEQMQAVLQNLPSWAGDVFYFLAETGARPGEAGRLVFSDIDHDRGLVACTSYKGTGEAKKRFLPMSDNLAQFLKAKHEHARKFFDGHGADLVFRNSKDKPVTSDTLGDVVRVTTKALGYSAITTYGLRHSYISKLVEMNVHMQKIKALAGHTKDATTSRYVQVKEAGLRDVVTDMASFRKLSR